MSRKDERHAKRHAILRTERDFIHYSRYICNRKWWYTASFDIAIGVWMLICGIIMLVFQSEGTLSVAGIVLATASCALPVLLNRFLVDDFIIVGGICVVAPERQRTSVPLFIATFATFMFTICFCIVNIHSPQFLVGIILAFICAMAFCFTNRMRYLVSAGAMVAAFFLVTRMGWPASLMGIQRLGLSLLLSGVVVLIAGIVAFVHDFALADEGQEQLIDEDTKTLTALYTTDELQTALVSPDRDIRFLAALFLEQSMDPAMLVTLIKMTCDDDSHVAQAARHALGSVWGPDPDELIRWEIEHGVGRNFRKNGYRISTDELIELDRRRMAIERRSRAHELAVEKVLESSVASDTGALSDLIALASGSAQAVDKDTRVVAAEMLGSTRTHRAYAALIDLMLRGDRDIRAAAEEGFKGASAAAFIHIRPLFNDAREWVRVAAVNAGLNLIVSLDEEDRHEASVARDMMRTDILSLANHPSPVTRASTLELLAQYGSEMQETVESMCEDRFALVRGEAIRALTLMDVPAARTRVIQALADERSFVRMTAVDCVGRLKVKEALPVVQNLINDPDEKVATSARRVMFISQAW